MTPLIVLVVVTLLARLAGQLGVRPLRAWSAATRVGFAAMLLFIAAAHFNSMRPDLVAMVPPVIPNPELMVTFTGFCEILGAVGLLIPRTRRIAAVALIVFLLAVLPANIHAAQAGLTLGGAPVTPLVPRVALQFLFIALLWWSGVRNAGLQEGPAKGDGLS
ncbi:MAG: DoxX family membrane protein [Thermoanaerobaculia bacterium]